jgi:hypothetical protein
MKMRWEGWCDMALSMKGGANLLFKIYNEVVELMPFRASDAVSEMISRCGCYCPALFGMVFTLFASD